MIENNVIIIPFYTYGDKTRQEITRKCFKHYKIISDETGWPVVGVGSEGFLSRDLFLEFFPKEWYTEFFQDWKDIPPSGGSSGLSRKYNASINFVKREFNPTHYTMVGSDDFISLRYFEFLPEQIDFSIISGPYIMYDYINKQPYFYGPKEPSTIASTGSGIVMSKELLENLNWIPYSYGNDEVGLEKAVFDRGFPINGLNHWGQDDLVTLKSNMTINSLDLFQENLNPISYETDFLSYILAL